MELMLRDLVHKFCEKEKTRRGIQDNPLLPLELELLRLTGRMGSAVYPMWSDAECGYVRENCYLPKKMPFEDPWLPSLSVEQQLRTIEWKRPGEFRENPTVVATLRPQDVCQELVGDCSFVCSVTICANYEQRFKGAKLISRAIYPQDVNGVPVYNPKGKYAVKMLLNGAVRVVVVDDRLPIDTATGRLVCSHSSHDDELCVSLLEKAFVKVFGGSYEFSGSTSSTDMYALCGWLPQIVPLDDDRGADIKSVLWGLLERNLRSGKLVFTINTSKDMAKEVEEKLKLVPGHAYAVLDVKEALGNQLLKVRNPWARQPWEGLFSIQDNRRWTDDMREAFQYTKEEADRGIFWISWADTFKFFHRAHVSWNPFSLFESPNAKLLRITRHGMLDKRACVGKSALLFYQPQYHMPVDAAKDTTVWVLLSRHLSSTISERDEAKIPLITLHVYEVTQDEASFYRQTRGEGMSFICGNDGGGAGCCGTRQILIANKGKSNVVHDGTYRNTTHYLVKVPVRRGRHDFVIAVSSMDPSENLYYSLVAHTELSQQFIGLHEVPQNALPYARTIKGAWKRGSNCGGNVSLPTWGFNPQYTFVVKKPTHVSLVLTCQAEQHGIGMHLVQWADGALVSAFPWSARVESLETRDKDILSLHHTPVYTPCGVRLCTFNGGYCIYRKTDVDDNDNDDVDGVDNPAPPPSAPPPPELLDLVINVVNHGQFEVVFPRDATPQQVFIFLLSKKIPAHVATSKLIHNGASLTVTEPMSNVPPGSTVNVVLPPPLGTTDELNVIEDRLHGAISGVAAVWSTFIDPTLKNAMIHSPDTTQLLSLQKELMCHDEVTTKILLDLDSLVDLPDDVRPTRKQHVQDAQATHQIIDTLKAEVMHLLKDKKAAADTGNGGGSNKMKKAVKPKPLSPGVYTLVVSAFEMSKPGDFTLHFESQDKALVDSVEEVPAEGYGAPNWLLSNIQGTWTENPFYSTIHVKSNRTNIFMRLLVISGASRGKFESPCTMTLKKKASGAVVASVGPQCDVWSLHALGLDAGEYLVEVLCGVEHCEHTFVVKVAMK
eukprot:PhM_4_TR4233/c0_g2_i1/m.60864/K08576/CAPN7; calpain-7